MLNKIFKILTAETSVDKQTFLVVMYPIQAVFFNKPPVYLLFNSVTCTKMNRGPESKFKAIRDIYIQVIKTKMQLLDLQRHFYL